MKKSPFSFYKILLVTLITSLSITGISFIDNQIWKIIMLVAGLVAYTIVGFLYSCRIISGSEAGKEAYAFVVILLIIISYALYRLFIDVQNWILSWPLAVKIVVPLTLLFLIAFVIILRVKEEKGFAGD